MKKILCIIGLAVLMASCTYKEDGSPRYLQYNLASFNVSMMDCSATSVVGMLSHADAAQKDTILKAGYDSTFVSYSALGYFDGNYNLYSEVKVFLSGTDSTWTFATTDKAQSIDFAGTVKMLGRDSRGNPVFEAEYLGTYTESGGFTADFASTGKIKMYWEEVNYYSAYYGASLTYALFKDGKITLTTYYNGDKLDDSVVMLAGDSVSYGKAE